MQATQINRPMEDTKPWFKQFWPWVLIGIPGLTVLACSVTIYLAITSSDGLVADDYYKEGLAINDVLGKTTLAAELELSAYLRLNDEGNMEFFFVAPETTETLTLKLIHPTRSNQDKTLELAPSAKGIYKAQLPLLAAGNWHLHLIDQTNDWKIKGRLKYPTGRSARLNP